LFEETLLRVGGEHPLVVGDRLDTDIEGAVRTGYDSLLVMTGVTGLTELVAAPRGSRPTYLAATLSGLLEPQPVPTAGPGWRLGGWEGRISDARLTVGGAGSADDWWRVVATAGWAWSDETGEPPAVEGLAAPEA
jgi:hypothetical protein